MAALLSPTSPDRHGLARKGKATPGYYKRPESCQLEKKKETWPGGHCELFFSLPGCVILVAHDTPPHPTHFFFVSIRYEVHSVRYKWVAEPLTDRSAGEFHLLSCCGRSPAEGTPMPTPRISPLPGFSPLLFRAPSIQKVPYAHLKPNSIPHKLLPYKNVFLL